MAVFALRFSLSVQYKVRNETECGWHSHHAILVSKGQNRCHLIMPLNPSLGMNFVIMGNSCREHDLDWVHSFRRTGVTLCTIFPSKIISEADICFHF